MDTCTNCGASLRPGAKFCTTCGTRLNEMPTANSGWGTPSATSEDDNQETSVMQTVEPSGPEPAEPAPSEGSWRSTSSGWSTAYGDSTTAADDPASRFRSALDSEVQPVTDAKEEELQEDSASTWETPAPAFTPPPPSTWSYTGTETSSSESTETEAEVEEISDWKAPSTWGTTEVIEEDLESEPDTDFEEEVDAAGFTDDGDDEVDFLSGDENIEVSGEPQPLLPPDEARDKAIALADELRRTIRMMSSSGESDHGAAIMALTEASLNVGDFSDVRGVLADVKSDPRDIQALSTLAGKIDRIEALLDDHASMAQTIENAITELNG